jgi:pimeloyl-ACP methyl ester carboxylesterase
MAFNLMNLISARHAAPVVVLLVALAAMQGCAPAAAPTPAQATVAPAVQPTATAAPLAAPIPATATVPPEAATPKAVDTSQPSGDSLDGHWEGAVEVAGQNLTTRVDFKTEGGVLKGTVDFPQQNANGLPLEKVSRQGDKLHFEVLPSPRTAVFDGALQGTDKITGSFQQAVYVGTFHLERTPVQASEPLPYKEEEVTFRNGDVTLAGTLTLPETQGPHPAVVLITGSGAENRDEEVFGFKVFRVLADHLTRKGIAVLRYDDRGVGGSSTGTEQDTSETSADDVAAAVKFLQRRPDINPEEIGLVGHSEGGIIAPMVAVRSSDAGGPPVAFLILMSGPGQPGRQILADQTGLILKANGASQAVIDEKVALEKRAIEAAMTGQGWEEVKAEIRKQYQAAAAALSDDQRKAIGDVNQWVEKSVEAQVQALKSPWMQFFLAYDPAPALEKVTAPVLALFGGLDTQVPAEANRDAVMKALDKGGNKDHTAKIFPDANHLYQSAVTGSPNEYATLKPEFTAGFLDSISDWILARVPVAGK